MVRLISFLVGLFFSGWLLVSLIMGAYAYVTEPATPKPEAAFFKDPKHVEFAHDGVFGKWDKAQLQRGFKVYNEVCSACHGLRHVAFGDLMDIGYSEEQAKAFAASKQVPSINDQTGEPDTRPGTLADKFPSPFANDVAASAANGGAIPPDLSLITKARHHGPAYLYSLLSGYQDPPANLPAEIQPAAGKYFNPYFASLNLSMGPPLSEGQVTFDDGSPSTVDAMSKDVAAFLTWTAEPKMMERKAAGLGTLLFLLLATMLAYMSYRTVWAEKKGH